MWSRTRSGLAVKARRWRSRHGIAARQVAVRSHAPWYLKTLLAAGGVLLAVVAGQAIYDAGRGWVGRDISDVQSEASHLRERLAVVEAELASVQQKADAAHSNSQIERSARAQLEAQMRSLESENSRLREDMLVFESLAGASGAVQGFKINRLALEPDGDVGRYRYRMLIIRQGGKPDQDVKGSYEIVATIDRKGQGATITFPSDGSGAAYLLAFRYFQRVDGVISLPEGAVLKSVEVRFLQDGQIKARATAAI